VTTTAATAHLNPDAFFPCALDITMLPTLSLSLSHSAPPCYQKFFIDEFHCNWETAKTWQESRKEERKPKRGEETGRVMTYERLIKETEDSAINMGLYNEHGFKTK
jgi:hypothetical protein